MYKHAASASPRTVAPRPSPPAFFLEDTGPFPLPSLIKSTSAARSPCPPPLLPPPPRRQRRPALSRALRARQHPPPPHSSSRRFGSRCSGFILLLCFFHHSSLLRPPPSPPSFAHLLPLPAGKLGELQVKLLSCFVSLPRIFIFLSLALFPLPLNLAP